MCQGQTQRRLGVKHDEMAKRRMRKEIPTLVGERRDVIPIVFVLRCAVGAC